MLLNLAWFVFICFSIVTSSGRPSPSSSDALSSFIVEFAIVLLFSRCIFDDIWNPWSRSLVRPVRGPLRSIAGFIVILDATLGTIDVWNTFDRFRPPLDPGRLPIWLLSSVCYILYGWFSLSSIWKVETALALSRVLWLAISNGFISSKSVLN